MEDDYKTPLDDVEFSKSMFNQPFIRSSNPLINQVNENKSPERIDGKRSKKVNNDNLMELVLFVIIIIVLIFLVGLLSLIPSGLPNPR